MLLCAIVLLLAPLGAGCTGASEDCRSAPGTPRIVQQHPRRADLEEIDVLLREAGWAPQADPVARPVPDRVYALRETEGSRLVLAYYDGRAHGTAHGTWKCTR